ncbi:unnamed protein product [Vitrella brassicaformis CCMP3155]|uniref:Uncharacterized protein n=1 Tax=Vitrella brassicaformis (strain CCMP3155) TaxID=1169540 RepID=A0A0G4EXF3_VITBC|nr:unnamed protein product [Vitrella brassicaformis CCMP3155]|eukprot:CEM02792.1 unnamed protein product [Vitrella brassicaformis CCMP3155]
MNISIHLNTPEGQVRPMCSFCRAHHFASLSSSHRRTLCAGRWTRRIRELYREYFDYEAARRFTPGLEIVVHPEGYTGQIFNVEAFPFVPPFHGHVLAELHYTHIWVEPTPPPQQQGPVPDTQMTDAAEHGHTDTQPGAQEMDTAATQPVVRIFPILTDAELRGLARDAFDQNNRRGNTEEAAVQAGTDIWEARRMFTSAERFAIWLRSIVRLVNNELRNGTWSKRRGLGLFNFEAKRLLLILGITKGCKPYFPDFEWDDEDPDEDDESWGGPAHQQQPALATPAAASTSASQKAQKDAVTESPAAGGAAGPAQPLHTYGQQDAHGRHRRGHRSHTVYERRAETVVVTSILATMPTRPTVAELIEYGKTVADGEEEREGEQTAAKKRSTHTAKIHTQALVSAVVPTMSGKMSQMKALAITGSAQ